MSAFAFTKKVDFSKYLFLHNQGGMKAVIMTDTFQSAVLLGSLAAVLGLGATGVGGLSVAWDHARRTDRLHFFE